MFDLLHGATDEGGSSDQARPDPAPPASPGEPAQATRREPDQVRGPRGARLAAAGSRSRARIADAGSRSKVWLADAGSHSRERLTEAGSQSKGWLAGAHARSAGGLAGASRGAVRLGGASRGLVQRGGVQLAGMPKSAVLAVGAAFVFAVALIAVGIALVLGRAPDETPPVLAGAQAATPSAQPSLTLAPDTPGRLSGTPYAGPLAALAPASVAASCEHVPTDDAGGNLLTYEAEHAIDDDPETVWRCAGDGLGERLVIDLGQPRVVGRVGVVPGFAATDPVNSANRYAENRRITMVRWRFDGDRFVDQELDPDPERRDLQTLRIPPVETSRVTMVVRGSSEGERDTVAAGTVRLSGPR